MTGIILAAFFVVATVSTFPEDVRDGAVRFRRIGASKPQPRCPKGSEVVETPGGLVAFRCEVAGPYRRARIGGEVEFDYPRDWHLTDAWTDDPPAVYMVLESNRPGKPVTMLLSKYRRGRPGYVPVRSAIRRDKELQGAREGSSGRVAGLPARFLSVARESDMAYVEAAPGLYYTLSFSAPTELYGLYEPLYQRLLKSFRIAKETNE